MPDLKITNNSTEQLVVSDPDSPLTITVAGGVTKTTTVEPEALERMREGLAELDDKTLGDGSAFADIDVLQSVANDDLEYEAASADVTRYLANRIIYGSAVSNPTTPSTVSNRDFDIDSEGEAFIDGEHYDVASATDVSADAEVDTDGADFSGTNLSTDKDRYAHLCLVNNGGTVETVMVFGAEADNGNADKLSDDEIASAVGAYLGESTSVYAFTEWAEILFSESSGLSQTTTMLRPVPPSYS